MVCAGLIFFLVILQVIGADEPKAAPSPPLRSESEEETIAKCLKDLESQSPETRKSAVMLLGKYKVPEARTALVRSLKDGSADVRRSALVSLIEDMIVPQEAALPILGMLADEDVHIRRIASAAIPQATMATRPGMVISGSGTVVRPAKEKGALPASAVKTISAAFSDPDPGVRKNMVAYFGSLHPNVGAELLAPLLKDKEKDVRLLALDTVMRYKPELVVSSLDDLACDEDADVRLALAKSLRFQFAGGEGVKVLVKMLDDKSGPVRAEAATALLISRNLNRFDDIVEILLDPSTDVQSAKQMISFLPAAGEDRAMPVFEKLLSDTREPVRVSATAMYISMKGQELPTAETVKFLDDPSRDVRAAAANNILRMKDIDDKLLAQIIRNRNADVRGALANFAWSLPPQKAQAVVDELILDENDSVRESALHVIARRKFPGHMETLEMSLSDGSPQIRTAAADELLSINTTDAKKILLDYVAKNPEDETAEIIKGRINEAKPKKRQIGPLREDDGR